MRGTGLPIALVALALFAGACGFDPVGAASGQAVEPGSQDAGAPDAGRQPTGEPDAAADGEDRRGVLESVPVTTAPELDGEVEAAWQGAERVSFPLAEAMQYFNLHDDYGWDGAVEFASLYDGDHIYFLFEVTDGLLRDDSEESWDDDAIELYLDAAGDGSGPYGADDHWLVIQSSGLYESLGPAEIEISGTIVETESGYRMELAVERAQLGAAASGALGFNVGLVDDDGLGNDYGADAYGLWFAPDGPHCDECCEEEDTPRAWCDTTMLGRLELGAGS